MCVTTARIYTLIDPRIRIRSHTPKHLAHPVGRQIIAHLGFTMTTGLSDNEQAVSRAYPHQVVAHEVTAESSDCLDDTCTSGNSQTSRLFCNGGVEVVENLLPTETSDQLFEKVLQEVQWETMMHRGGEVPRQVAVQGLTYSDGRVSHISR